MSAIRAGEAPVRLLCASARVRTEASREVQLRRAAAPTRDYQAELGRAEVVEMHTSRQQRRAVGSRISAVSRIVLALGLATTSSPTFASSMLTDSIPAGPLARSLDKLATATGIQLLYDTTLVENRSAPPVAGKTSALEALHSLLEGSGITFHQTGPDAFALVREKPVDKSPVTRTQTVSRSPSEIAVVTVVGVKDRINTPPDEVRTALKMPATILKTPAAIDVVSSSELEELAADRLERAVTRVPGVFALPSGTSALAFALRGFPTQQYYVDGVRVSPELHQDGFKDLTNVERIEVLKGPASILYGRGEPGGIINVVSKEPQPEDRVSLELMAGSFGTQRGALDVTGPVGGSSSVFYRLTAAYQESQSYRQFVHDHRLVVSPSITWRFAPTSSLTAYAEVLNSRDFNEGGIPLVGTQIPDVPNSRNLLGPGATIDTRDARVGVRGSIALSDRWQLRPHIDLRWLSTPAPAQLGLDVDGLDPAACSPQVCPVARLMYANPVSTGRTLYVSADLIGNEHFAGARHKLLLGAEAFDVRARYDLVARSYGSLAIDLYRPVYSDVPVGLLAVPDTSYSEVALSRWFAIYAQDRTELTERWTTLFGARFDLANELLNTRDLIQHAASTPPAREQRETSFKPRAAVVYEVRHNLNVYGSYSENFGLANGRAIGGLGGSGAPLPAETAQQWEVGFKYGNGVARPSFSASLFDLTKQNIAIADPNPFRATQGYLRVIGAARSRGAEAEIHVHPVPAWECSATLAYTDTRIVRDSGTATDASGNVIVTSGNTGHRLYGIPRFAGSVWAAYTSDHGWRIATGVAAKGARMGNNANEYTLSGYKVWTFMAARTWRAHNMNVTGQLNVDNVLSAYYAEPLAGSYEIVPGSPRLWRITMRLDF